MIDIFNKLKTDFEYYTGAKYKGLVKAIGAGFASRLSDFIGKLNFIKKQAFVWSADKDYLYAHAAHLLESYPSEIAEGYVVFYGDEGSLAAVGTEIKDDNSVYKTTANASISAFQFSGNVTVAAGVATLVVDHQMTNTSCLVNGVTTDVTTTPTDLSFDAGTLVDGNLVTIDVVKSTLVPIVALEAGAAENRVYNDVLQTKVTISGVNKDAGVSVLAGGKDAEDVESYRERVMFFLANPQAPFNDNNIKAVALAENKTIRYVWVKGGDFAVGKAKLYVLNNSYGLTTAENNAVLASAQSIKPAQMPLASISVVMPAVGTQDVVIQDLLPASDGLKAEITKNIEYLFDVDLFEGGVTAQAIEAAIYRSTNGAEKVSSFTLVSGECLPVTDKFWKLGTVSFL